MSLDLCSNQCKTIPSLLKERSKKRANHPFFIYLDGDCSEKKWTYYDFYSQVERIASNLYQRGLSKGDKVLVHLENSPEFLLTWFACARLGVVSVLSNTSFSSELIRHCYEVSAAKAVITHASYCDAVDRAVYNSDLFVVVENKDEKIDDPNHILQNETVSFNEFLCDAKKPLDTVINPADPLTVVFTSGTTSQPKGVVWTHANVFGACQVNGRQLYLNEDDVTYCHMPLFHVIALSYQVLTTFWLGGTVVLQSRFDTVRFWELSLKYRCSWAVMIGYDVVHLIGRQVPQHAYRIWYTSSIYPKWEEEFSIKTIGGWGMSETICPAIISDRFLAEPKYAIGNISSALDVKIVDKSGNSVAFGSVGDLLVKGFPGISLFLEYLNEPEATKESFDDRGWFKTGDRIKVSDDGFLFFVERKEDLLKVAGENVSSKAVEEIIYESGLVKEVCIVGESDDLLGEIPVAFVIPRGKIQGNISEMILQFCRDRMATFMIPHRVFLLDNFPRSQFNKIAKHKLKKMFLSDNVGGFLARPDVGDYYQTPKTPTQKRLAQIWSKVFYLDVIDLYDDFFQLGGHSLHAIKISGKIGREFTLSIPVNLIYEKSSLKELADHIDLLLKIRKNLCVGEQKDSGSVDIIEF